MKVGNFDNWDKTNIKALAEALGVSRSYIYQLRKWQIHPSVDMARKLEHNTGIHRNMWLWPDDYDNHLIDTSEYHAKKEAEQSETA